MHIPFNKPYITGTEIMYLKEAINLRKFSGDGKFTLMVQELLENKYSFRKTLLTTSCTDALELSGLLLDLDSDSEIIVPSYTFVSTANAFALRGAKIVFADSEKLTPNVDVDKIEQLITPKTKAIVVVHYAGIACDMGKIMDLATKYNIKVIEDAAQAIDSYYNGIPLGSIGTFGAFSFHETKNIISGEGGLLSVNDPNYVLRAEIMREKGTNRSQYFRGEVDKYGWVDLGSSFLASELNAAFLFAQLERISEIQSKRVALWDRYNQNLIALSGKIEGILPYIPTFASNNGHMYYLKCENLNDRTKLIKYLDSKGVKSAFHYSSLHSSKFFNEKHDGRNLQESDKWTDCLLRIPMFFELENSDADYISAQILEYYNV